MSSRELVEHGPTAAPPRLSGAASEMDAVVSGRRILSLLSTPPSSSFQAHRPTNIHAYCSDAMSSPKHHPTPSGQAPKPKGILKNPLDRRPSQPGPTDDEIAANDSLAINTSGLQPTGAAAAAAGPNGLSWDESNIALHDFEKESTQRMKIDEPKTPFVRGSGGFSDDEGGFDCESKQQ